MHSSRIALVLICVLVATSWIACSQDENEPCQLNGDCADGLICVRAQRSERGACKDPGQVVDSGMAPVGEEPPLTPDEDAGELPDSGAAMDGSASGDASAPAGDAAAVGDAGPDAGDAGDPLGEDAGG